MGNSSNKNVCKPLQQNVYYMHLPLFVLDIVRMYQDFPTYKNGIKQNDIVGILQKEHFASGDLVAQVASAIKILEAVGYIRNTNGGYKTLGPLAPLADAKTIKQRNATWDKIKEGFY